MVVKGLCKQEQTKDTLTLAQSKVIATLIWKNKLSDGKEPISS